MPHSGRPQPERPTMPNPPSMPVPVQALPPRRQPQLDARRKGLVDDPEWYKKAVFYEVMIRSFSDSGDGGSGDLRGLVERLDYLEWLGVDCLWLPPFFPSPLRDGGYDVADFTAVSPQFGTMADFSDLIAAAHERGIRVVIDLVMNHTSDAHPGSRRRAPTPTGRTATSTCGATTPRGTRARGSSSSTPRRRTGRSTRCGGSTSGTGSSATSPT
nr:hypothetical protein GCM10025730_42230 [Promicromonospora thailandica]